MAADSSLLDHNMNDTCEESISETVSADSTLGAYLARRLVQVGITDVFAVPGDSILSLLDHITAQPSLNLIACCNELNAGYAADGYARSRGVAACVFTFNVGGLSVVNAIAGAFCESIPLLCIVGAPHSNYYGTNATLHHAIAPLDFNKELRCFEPITCYQAVVNDLEDAHEKIDAAITTALKESKPVIISISSNLPGRPHPSFNQKPIPFCFPLKVSNPMSLEAAVEAAAKFLNKAVKPVLVGGPKLRIADACGPFVELADACGYALAVMPAAKGLVPENHPQFIGTYWGAVSTEFCAEIVESADAYLYAGPIFDDLTCVGNSFIFNKEKAIVVQPERVVIANGPTFGCIQMKDFFQALAKRLKRNTASYESYRRIYVPEGLTLLYCNPKEPLTINVLFKHTERMLSSDSIVISDAGDSWFNCQKLKLPQGCGYECQLQYASIGWSIGATLGYAQATPEKRVMSFTGDGSFQMTAQEMSTMLRCGQKNIIFLINNGGYAMEELMNEAPYNVIKNWDYTGLIHAFDNGEGKCWTAKVHCEEELTGAIEMAMGDKKNCLCFIEVIVDMYDTSKELLQFVNCLAAPIL
ncbi:hypothetical protein F0562_017723 [Nyssa sinensis]|uniref:pyruvate decarboxylase n=1 Tax=Nyssa sinensis TaxID=561372 RepID=A0A5J4ZFX8_9ASTE|nr:hypothetical protein F0562_017723 [Nyssa sinensis]